MKAHSVRVGAWLLVGLGLWGCKDKGNTSAAEAAKHVAKMAELVDKDVAEVERGLPEGAKRLAPLFVATAPDGGTPTAFDAKQDLPAVRSRLLKVTREVPDLNVAKSTFFAVADEKGIAIRNNLEQDAMAGQNLAATFPELTKALGGAAFVTTTGAFPGAQSPAGPDKDWIAATPIRRPDGAVAGLFVTGWAFRRFAKHVKETLEHDLKEELMKNGDTGKLPILYVAMFDRAGVYGAPQTPSVNEKALEGEHLVDKTAAGPVSGVLTITERAFGYAAVRTPKLGADVGVAILRSE